MTITVFANQKGGVGKTLVTAGCAHAAAAAGKRVLLVDCDPQGNTTKHFGGGTSELTLADVLDRRTRTPLHDVVVQTMREGIDLVPSGFDGLQAVQDSLVGQPGAESSLNKALRPLAAQWDYVFIDTRPAVDLITRNALMAADNLVVVVQPERDAIDGSTLTLNALADLQEFLGKDLPVAGWVINLVDGRRNDHAADLELIRTMTAESNVEILGEPIPSVADLARLNIVGMGADQHPSPSARMRNLAANFAAILAGLDHATAIATGAAS